MTQTITMQHGTAAYRQYFSMVETTLQAGNTVTLAFGGTSMAPTLRASDRLTLAPLAGNRPEVGEVVLFRHEGMYKVHRVKEVHGARYTMQGDNCYGVEHATLDDIVARLVSVERLGPTDGPRWAKVSRRSLARKRVKNLAIRWLGHKGRRQLRPWYFTALALLMWAPVGKLGVPLDNFVLGIRADHLLHASVFVPCTLFVMDATKRRWLVWLIGIGVGVVTESVQYLLPYRGFDINDMMANALGATLGWIILQLSLRKFNTQ